MNSSAATTRRGSEIGRFIRLHWPVLTARLPEKFSFFQGKADGVVEGFCAPELWPNRWIHSRGGSLFASDQTVPERYSACGIQGRGGSEYVFAFWREGARRFSFYDQYVVHGLKEAASCQKTAERLEAALVRWKRGDPLVVFSGPWGWFDPVTGDFERDHQVLPGEFGKFYQELVARSRAEISRRANETPSGSASGAGEADAFNALIARYRSGTADLEVAAGAAALLPGLAPIPRAACVLLALLTSFRAGDARRARQWAVRLNQAARGTDLPGIPSQQLNGAVMIEEQDLAPIIQSLAAMDQPAAGTQEEREAIQSLLAQYQKNKTRFPLPCPVAPVSAERTGPSPAVRLPIGTGIGSERGDRRRDTLPGLPPKVAYGILFGFLALVLLIFAYVFSFP